MSKEFNKWFHGEYGGVKPCEAEPYDKEEMVDAFRAGRALGRREAVVIVRGKAAGYHCLAFERKALGEAAAAIEAIPEEVGE